MNAQLANLTSDIPGIGGRIKQYPEDFFVEEMPGYLPSGRGEHIYLFIEKKQRTTTDVIRRLAKAMRVGKSDVGYAGLKDKHAVTRQMFSVWLPDADPVRDADRLGRVEMPGIKMLWASRHRNKLRRGHHVGNRFEIRIRGVAPDSLPAAKHVLERLASMGVPNYVGEQRFGYREDNHELGKLLILGQWQSLLDLMLGQPRETDHPATRSGREAYERGDYAAALEVWPRHLRHDRQALDALRQGKNAQQAVMNISRQQRGFLISSLQSVMFNRVLDRRIREDLFDRLIEGDLAWKHDSRAVFAVDLVTAGVENALGARMPRQEVSPSGPMWGVRMPRASGIVEQWESDALAQMGLTEADLGGGPQAYAEGRRRPLRVSLTNPDANAGEDEYGHYIRVAFELPTGSFATVVLNEMMKNGFATDNHSPAVLDEN